MFNIYSIGFSINNALMMQASDIIKGGLNQLATKSLFSKKVTTFHMLNMGINTLMPFVVVVVVAVVVVVVVVVLHLLYEKKHRFGLKNVFLVKIV